MDRLVRDVRVAVRGLRRNATFTVTAVLVLGLGIGMATAMWVVFNAALLHRLPVRDEDRIVLPRTLDRAGTDVAMPDRELDEARRESRTMRDMAGVGDWGAYDFPFLDGDQPVHLGQADVTNNFFDVLGVHPVLGRLLNSQDDSASRVVVLSYGAWRRRFGGNASIVGHHLTQPGTGWTFTIVGVAPPGLDFPAGTDCWTPLEASFYSVDILARLAPGASPAAARAEFLAAMERISARRSASLNIARADIRTLRVAIVGNARPALVVLASAAGLLLLVACVNAGNLLLLRAMRRARELAVRRALGATYADVARELLIENILLGLGGAALGLVIAETARRALIAAAPPQLPGLDVVQMGGSPLGTAAGVTLVTVLLFGIAPALTAVHRNAVSALRLDARAGVSTRQQRRTRQLLVASQVALALIMLAGAGLLTRSLRQLETVRLGYAPEHLAFAELTIPDRHWDTVTHAFPVYEALEPRLMAIPGVTSATPLLEPPFSGLDVSGVWEIEGQSPAQAAANPMVPIEIGNADYFRTLGIAVRRGRGFLATDQGNAPHVAVVSEAAARLFWPGQDPIGKRLRLAHSKQPWVTVVGIAADIRYRSLSEAPPTVFLSWRQTFYWQGLIALRTATNVVGLASAIRRVVADVYPDVTVWRVQSMDDYLAQPLARPRLSATLLSAFGLTALLLAAIGLYGVMASLVREQTRDIGVRMALGATPERLRREVLTRALAVSASGAAFGLLGALITSRFLRSLLFEISPADPIALGGACVTLLCVALIAAYIPARYASRVDPARVLQAD